MWWLAIAAWLWPPDETISAYVPEGASYALQTLGGRAAMGIVQFPSPGAVAGRGPCNLFSARQADPYPWIDIVDLRATRRACDPAEAAFFAFLEAAAQVEVSGPVLILTDEDGRMAVFERRP